MFIYDAITRESCSVLQFSIRNVSKVSRFNYLRVSIYNLTFAEAPEVRLGWKHSNFFNIIS